jgi:hypothetical protein
MLDKFSHRCPVLLENPKAVMEPRSVYNPDKELAETFGVTLETIQARRLRGAPVEDMGELAEWAMKEPGIFEGFTCNQDAADTLEAMEDPSWRAKSRRPWPAGERRRRAGRGRGWRPAEGGAASEIRDHQWLVILSEGKNTPEDASDLGGCVSACVEASPNVRFQVMCK